MSDFHGETWEIENHSLNSCDKWLSWLRRLSKLTGISNLDGDQESDGYSLDFCHDLFTEGKSPEDVACILA